MTDPKDAQAQIDSMWRMFLVDGLHTKQFQHRHVFGLLPAEPRCRLCQAPFSGLGGLVMRTIYDKRPSQLNPNLCDACERFAEQYQGGAELELSLLFVDVRGSTSLAEGMRPTEFGQLINRFYKAATEVLIQTDALIDKLVGDQVAGIYVPGFAGPDHARRALQAAQGILRLTGHKDPGGPWIPAGAGVHTGVAFVGSVGTDRAHEITVLGDAANTAARLSSSARQGEILISEAACTAAGLEVSHLEQRVLDLKGKSERVTVRVLTDYDAG
jgi:adenylate cyclase